VQWEINVLFPEPVIPITAISTFFGFSGAFSNAVEPSTLVFIVGRFTFAVIILVGDYKAKGELRPGKLDNVMRSRYVERVSERHRNEIRCRMMNDTQGVSCKQGM
jgi:hypothetical protein